jgi:hypothetical protein
LSVGIGAKHPLKQIFRGFGKRQLTKKFKKIPKKKIKTLILLPGLLLFIE